MLLKIVSIIVFLIGLSGILLVIGAGQLKTEEDRINEREEEAKYWEEYEKERIQKKQEKARKRHERRNKITRIFNKYLHIL